MQNKIEYSNLLVTFNGNLIFLADKDFEVMGIEEFNDELIFTLRA